MKPCALTHEEVRAFLVALGIGPLNDVRSVLIAPQYVEVVKLMRDEGGDVRLNPEGTAVMEQTQRYRYAGAPWEVMM